MAPPLLEGINKVGVVIDDLTQKCCLSAQQSATAVVESFKIGILGIKFKLKCNIWYWLFADLFQFLSSFLTIPSKVQKCKKKVKAFKVFYSFKELQTYCHLISKSKEQKTKKNFLKSKRTLIFPYQVPDVSLIVRVPIALFPRELTTLGISANTEIPVRQRGRKGEQG